ncbi:hypothetical protein [Parasitella parasitica]|uniref:Uncharacterized protein n=1 Tax=Parasitella parasitica TaxID=35722 RepID=A0A0B7MWB8_9FUNG|nr:hypothetical protein [Parasitella parasitica]
MALVTDSTGASESRYKYLMKSAKFWSKSKQKETSIAHNHINKEGHLPFHFTRKPSGSPTAALVESREAEIYKLSTIDDAGVYIPPSPGVTDKRDHWIDVNEDVMMNFHLPDLACLTSVGDKHNFFTPSTFILQSQSYILPIADMSESTLSSVPSLDETTTPLSCSSDSLMSPLI